MRRLFFTLVLLLISATLVFAQDSGTGGLDRRDKDDHDDKAPTQSGYAVVTPVGTTTSGLVVFETFGMRNNSGTTQAGVLPPDLTMSAVVFVESSRRLGKNLGIAIVNPNSSGANVTLSLRKSDGTQIAIATLIVPSHQQIAKFFTDLFANPFPPTLPAEFAGTLAITSDLAVSAIGLRFRGANFSTLPVTDLSGNAGSLPTIATGVGGPGAVLLPQFAANGGWATELVLMNTGTSTLTVRVDLFKQDGTPLTASLNGQTASSFVNLTIPAGGVLVLAPRDQDGDDDF
jgi:hypothetical protein